MMRLPSKASSCAFSVGLGCRQLAERFRHGAVKAGGHMAPHPPPAAASLGQPCHGPRFPPSAARFEDMSKQKDTYKVVVIEGGC